jgi:hypothetical protein
MKFSILICGLFRDEKLVEASIENFLKLREIGRVDRILISTWKSELQRYPELAGFLKSKKIEIIALAEPQVIMPGHLIHQMKTYSLGLHMFSDQDVVFKTRFDLAGIQITKLNDLMDCYFNESILTSNWPKIFEHKVVIDGGFIFQPFYLSDITFLGQVEDLRKLVNLDLTMEFYCSETAPEQWFHCAPFRMEFKFVRDLLAVNVGFNHNDEEQNRKFLNRALEMPFFKNFIAFYWNLLLTYYDAYDENEYNDNDVKDCSQFFKGLRINHVIYSKPPVPDLLSPLKYFIKQGAVNIMLCSMKDIQRSLKKQF